MSSLFFPWHPKPESTVQTTGSYTVPTGKFARAVCQVERGGSNLTINGSVVLRAPSSYSELDRNISADGTAAGGTTTIFTATRPAVVSFGAQNSPGITVQKIVNGNSIRIFNAASAGAAGTSDGAISHDNNSTYITPMYLGTGDAINITGVADRWFVSGQYTKVETMPEIALTNEYRLEAGDDINGGLKHIEVFPIIIN